MKDKKVYIDEAFATEELIPENLEDVAGGFDYEPADVDPADVAKEVVKCNQCKQTMTFCNAYKLKSGRSVWVYECTGCGNYRRTYHH